MAVTFHAGYGMCCPPTPRVPSFDPNTFNNAYPTIRVRIPVESINGTRDTWTLPDGEEYQQGTLLVFINGLAERVIIPISSTQFQTPYALDPSIDKEIRMLYQLKIPAQ